MTHCKLTLLSILLLFSPMLAAQDTPSAEPALQQAYQYYQQGQLEQAKQSYLQLQQQQPDHPDILLALAAIFQQQGQHQQSRHYLQQVLQQQPSHTLALAALSAYQPASQQDKLQQQLQTHPQAIVFFALGNQQAAQQRWPAAQQAYEAALRMTPENLIYRFNLAIAYDHLQQYRQAQHHYRQLLNQASLPRQISLPQLQQRLQQLAAHQESADE